MESLHSSYFWSRLFRQLICKLLNKSEIFKILSSKSSYNLQHFKKELKASTIHQFNSGLRTELHGLHKTLYLIFRSRMTNQSKMRPNTVKKRQPEESKLNLDDQSIAWRPCGQKEMLWLRCAVVKVSVALEVDSTLYHRWGSPICFLNSLGRHLSSPPPIVLCCRWQTDLTSRRRHEGRGLVGAGRGKQKHHGSATAVAVRRGGKQAARVSRARRREGREKGCGEACGVRSSG